MSTKATLSVKKETLVTHVTPPPKHVERERDQKKVQKGNV